MVGPSLLVVAGFFDGPAELALWIAALSIDYLGALVGQRAGLAHLAGSTSSSATG